MLERTRQPDVLREDRKWPTRKLTMAKQRGADQQSPSRPDGKVRQDADAVRAVKRPEPPKAGLLHELQVHQIELEMRNEELRRAQSALEESRDRYLELYEFAPVGYLTLSESGVITEANLTVAALLGVERGTLLRRRLDAYVVGDRDYTWRRRFAGLIRGKGEAAFDLVLKAGSGALVDTHVQSKPLAFAGQAPALRLTVIDISERLRAERALTSSEARLQTVLDTAMDGIITVDETQHIVRFNDAAESIFGWSREQVTGASLEMLIPEQFRRGHARHVEEFGRSGVTRRQMDGYRTIEALHRSGEVFKINAAISQITEAGRKFYTVVLRDITRQFSTETALATFQAKLRKLAMVSNTINEQEKRRISRELHDELGQVMTALKMDAVWLEQHLPRGQGALARKLVEMQGTLDGAMTSMRRIAANLRPFILDDLGFVAAAGSLVEKFRASTGIECRFNIAEADLELPEPYATEVFRVLQEALTNVTKHAEATLVEISIARTNGQVRLTVRDNGKGFSATSPTKPETFGLVGLRERAYLMRGRLSIDSAPGRGTLIRLSAPIARFGAVDEEFSE